MNARFDFLSGSKAGTSIPLLDRTLTIGRDRNQSISFALTDIVISAHHATLIRDGDTYRLRDDGSRNGTFVNGQPISEHQLADGDQVQFGAGGPIASFRISSREYISTVETRKTPAAQPGMPEPGMWELFKIVRREALRRTALALGVTTVIVALVVFGQEVLRRREQRRLADSLGLSRDTLVQNLVRLRARMDSLRRLVDDGQRRLAADPAIDLTAMRAMSRGVALLVFAYGYVDQASGEWLRSAVIGDQREGSAPDGNDSLTFAGQGQPLLQTGSATGFLVDSSGLLVTNRHVMEPWEEDLQLTALRSRGFNVTGKILRLRAFFPPGGISFDLRLVSQSPDADLALLQIERGSVGMPALPLAPPPPSPTAALKPGEQLVYIGYPAGAENLIFRAPRRDETDLMALAGKNEEALAEELARRRLIQPLILEGRVSDTTATDVVHTAPTSGGGSGGPLIGPQGTVVAVHYASVSPFPDRSFTTYRAVPVSRVWELLHRTTPRAHDITVR